MRRRPQIGSPLRSVARPKQARSEQTLLRILDAAEALIEEKGLADASIPEIVRRARSSVGGFYARFRDKNELLRALEERFFGQLRERVDELSDPERWVGAAVPEIVRRHVQELVETFRARQALIAAFLTRAARDPEFMEEGLRFRRDVSRRFCALLLTRREEISHPEPGTAIDLGVQLAFGLMHQMVAFGDIRVGDRRLSDAELVDELTRNFLAYVGAPVAGADRRRAP
jgi:AcrR family transcriptional regulator